DRPPEPPALHRLHGKVQAEVDQRVDEMAIAEDHAIAPAKQAHADGEHPRDVEQRRHEPRATYPRSPERRASTFARPGRRQAPAGEAPRERLERAERGRVANADPDDGRVDAALAQPAAEQLDLRRLAGAVEAAEGDQR